MKKEKAIKPNEMGLYSSPQTIRTQPKEVKLKQICLENILSRVLIN